MRSTSGKKKKKERQTDRASVRKKASKMVAVVFCSLHRRDILSLLPYSIHQKHVNGSSPYSKRELHKSVNTREAGGTESRSGRLPSTHMELK